MAVLLDVQKAVQNESFKTTHFALELSKLEIMNIDSTTADVKALVALVRNGA